MAKSGETQNWSGTGRIEIVSIGSDRCLWSSALLAAVTGAGVVIEIGGSGEGERAWSVGMDAVVVKTGVGGDLIMFGRVELAFFGHFGPSDRGR